MKQFLTIFVFIFVCHYTYPQHLNGFDLSDSLIPTKDILHGGPPRDGIPSIDHPLFQTAQTYRFFNSDAQVLGVYYNGVAKAYPINIMDWHEIVNDDFNGEPVAVTYCPLCGSGIAFKADLIKGPNKEFGVSGLLYNSDVLLYDRATKSLWSQIMGQAISGPMKGKYLEPVNTQRLTLEAWKQQHPETLILTTDTGFQRNYRSTPYGNYDRESRTYFPVDHQDNTFHKKTWVIGIEVNGSYKAYALKKLTKISTRKIVDRVGGETISLEWDKDTQYITIKDSQGKELVGLQMFWFAWSAFHPETEVYK